MTEPSKDTIFYNHSFLYSFDGIFNGQDRALQFGDGVYEWIRIHRGHPFALSYHVDRLYRSMRLIQIRATIAPDEFTEIHEVITEENKIEEGYCMLLVTRGVGEHEFTLPARSMKPNVLIYARPIDIEKVDQVKQGVSCITAEDDRWAHCDILSINMLPNILTRAAAVKKGAYDAIYLRDGLVTEATHSNLFIVKDGVLWTTPESAKLLKGITRQLIFTRVAPTSGVSVIEKKIDRELLSQAEEVFLTNSEAGIIPVLSIDGKPVAGGKVGRVTSVIQTHYDKLLEEGLP